MESARVWAERTFGGVKLGDKRRTRRVVEMAEAMARYPDGGLGRQMQGWGQQKAAYRLLDTEAVSHATLSAGHWQQTRQTGSVEGRTHLLVQDITEVDYSHHRETEGLGPIGNHQGQGFEVHSTLLVEPEVGEVIGLAHQAVWTRDREAPPKQESRTQRRQRENRQSQVWVKAVAAIGAVAQGSQWVYVGDRESDIFSYFTTIQAQGAHFCIRASQNRRVVSETEARYVLDEGRAIQAMSYQAVELNDGSTATLAVSWQSLKVRPPTYLKPAPAPIAVWVVRTWEVHPPPTRAALEWLLLTDVPVTSAHDAAERLLWYTRRWLIEEYHRCLKTGCRLEHSQLRHAARLQRLLAFLAILAVRLLQLRTLAQRDPDRPALQVVEPLLVQIVAVKFKTDLSALTLDRFWRYVAQLGGFPNRKRDDPPGWIRLWRGWLELLALADGVRLSQLLPPLPDVGNP